MIRSSFPDQLRRLVLAAVCLLSGMLPAPHAAAQTPSPDQIEMFRNLPPEQQQAILESMNKGGGSISGGTGVRSDRRLEFPRVVRPRKGDEEEATGFEADGITPREP